MQSTKHLPALSCSVNIKKSRRLAAFEKSFSLLASLSSCSCKIIKIRIINHYQTRFASLILRISNSVLLGAASWKTDIVEYYNNAISKGSDKTCIFIISPEPLLVTPSFSSLSSVNFKKVSCMASLLRGSGQPCAMKECVNC